MDDDEQWLERALTREKESLEAGSGVMRELFKQYEQAAREIRISVNDFFVRYEEEQGSADDRAAKLLNTAEMQEWKDSVEDWAKRIDEEKDDAAKQLLQSRLKMVECSASPRTRLDLVSGQMRIALDDLGAKNVRQMWNAFEALYSEAYYKKIFDIEQRHGSLREFKKLDSEMTDVLSHPWNGVNFADRMAENINRLHFEMEETVTQGWRHGKGSNVISKELSDQMGASFKHIEILVQGESAYFHNEAIRLAYEAAGVKQYEYVAKLDRRTSDTCLILDDKKFNVSDAKRGTNYPPMHPRCRSTTIEITDGMENLRLSGQPLPKDMTYEQWRKEQVEGTGKSSLDNFTPEEILKLKNHVIEEAQMLKDIGLTNKQLGPAVAGAYDRTTGKIYTAINDVEGKLPKELHPHIEKGIIDMPDDVYDSYSLYTHGAGSHAEVYAANKALLDNDNATLDDILIYVIKPGGSTKPVTDIPFHTCPHCNYILKGFPILSDL
ncbi:minor capsid protein [Paenibacillus sp. SC116]|nr:minor capsid protein [Paenibacillus sp. SC116]